MIKEDKIITFTKYILLQFYRITCFTFLWSYLISLLLIYHHPKLHGKTSSFQGIIRTFIVFEYLVVLLFYQFTCLCFKLNIFCLRSSNKFRIFTVTILYHLFILKKYLTFPISNRNRSNDKKVTDYMDVHNPAYVF